MSLLELDSQNDPKHCSNNNNNNRNNRSQRLNKKRLTHEQVRLLEMNFSSSKKLEPERKLLLARALGIPPRQVAIWYQNKRARWKNQRLELDYGSLQQQLHSALADKRQLERELSRVRAELNKAHETMFSLGAIPPGVVEASGPASYLSDEGCGSSSFHDDVSGCWMDAKFEELYACLIGADESSHG